MRICCNSRPAWRRKRGQGRHPGYAATPRRSRSSPVRAFVANLRPHVRSREQASMAMFAWLRRRRRDAIRRHAFPAAWRAFIEKNVPYVACLSPDDREELVGHIQVFLAEKHFEGCGGCRQRPARVPLSPVSPGTRDPPGGAETDLRAARCREGGVGRLPRRWRQRGAEGLLPGQAGGGQRLLGL